MTINTTYILITAISLAHIFICWRTQLLINGSFLTSFQKRLNSVLIWVLPFLWAFIVRSVVKRSEIKVMTKKDRKIRMSSGEAGESVAGAAGGAV